AELNHRELERYVQRVTDRWPIQRALLGGARVEDLRGAGPQRERGPEFVVVLVSEYFAGVPWLERVYVTGSLWDAYEMGAQADVHCYTPAVALPDRAQHGAEPAPGGRVRLRRAARAARHRAGTGGGARAARRGAPDAARPRRAAGAPARSAARGRRPGPRAGRGRPLAGD